MTKLGRTGPLVVVGAGPAGSLLALYLAQAGHDVEVHESRTDLRRSDHDGGRSINLALATRGIAALTEVGVMDRVDAITVSMAGRLIHAEGSVTLQPYGGNNEVIHSVSRHDLNAILLDAAEATGRVTFHFDQHCRHVDFDRNVATFSPYQQPESAREVRFGTLFGCDGASSVVREHLLRVNHGTARTNTLDHGYKELTIPAGPDGAFLLDPDGLHIWPRGELMLIALANPEGNFTTTLFMPHRGSVSNGSAGSFDALTTPHVVNDFFATNFADVPPLVNDLAQQFFNNPTGHLATIRVKGWSLDHRAVLVGDAAHAIVPFHGQGMNLAMESVRLLNRQLLRSPDDLDAAFKAFEAGRKADADAIADMALDNYVEMRAGVIDPDYLLRRELALELERRHPQRVAARYGMVMFTTMPYAQVQRRTVEQQAIFSSLTAQAASIDEIDLALAAKQVEALGPLPQWE